MGNSVSYNRARKLELWKN